MGLVQVPECAEVRLPQSRWRLSGCVGRGWSSLEIPAERSVSVVPVCKKCAGSQWGLQKYPVAAEDHLLAFTVALSNTLE